MAGAEVRIDLRQQRRFLFVTARHRVEVALFKRLTFAGKLCFEDAQKLHALFYQGVELCDIR
jgi:hypothetical protein